MKINLNLNKLKEKLTQESAKDIAFVLFTVLLLVIIMCGYNTQPAETPPEMAAGIDNTSGERAKEQEEQLKNTVAFDYNDKTKNKSLEDWKKINEDVVAVLDCSTYENGDVISNRVFPVVYNKNKDYLNHDVYNDKDIFGTPFIDTSPDAKNIVIYAHSSYEKEELMFTWIRNHALSSTKTFKEPVFYYETENGKNTYQIIGTADIDLRNDPWLSWTGEKFDATLPRYLKENCSSIFYPLEKIDEDKDAFITLVTCNMSKPNSRYVMIAKKID